MKKAGTGAAAAVAATAVMAPAVIAKKTYRWKMVTTWPPKLPVLQTGAERFAKRVDECTGGRLKIKAYAGGELVPPLNTFDAVSAGTVEMGSAAAYYWAGKMPACQWFAAVPFGLNAAGMSAWFHGGDGMNSGKRSTRPSTSFPGRAVPPVYQMVGGLTRRSTASRTSKV